MKRPQRVVPSHRLLHFVFYLWLGVAASCVIALVLVRITMSNWPSNPNPTFSSSVFCFCRESQAGSLRIGVLVVGILQVGIVPFGPKGRLSRKRQLANEKPPVESMF